MSNPEVSIIIPVHNEGDKLRRTLDALEATMPCAYEVLIIDDVSTDGCCDGIPNVLRPPERMGVAETRNFGAHHATAPMLLFLDGHCYPEPGWFERCHTALRRLGRGIVGPCISAAANREARGYGMVMGGLHIGPEWLGREFDHPYPVPMIAGCCMLMYRSFFDMIGRFDAMRVYGVEDTEICVRSWLLGYPVLVVPQAEVAHHFKEQTNYHVPWEAYVFNSLRMSVLHFDGDRLARMLAHWSSYPGYEKAWESLQECNVWARRDWLRERRAHDAGWYCRKFSISL